MSDPCWLGALEMARAIAARRLSPVEIVQAHLTRIEQHDGKLRSYLAVFGESALAAARSAEADAVAGKKLGPMHGVPVAVKDLYDVAGTPTTAGCSFLKQPAKQDCTAVARLRAAGAIILGKLNLHQFAYGPEGINREFGTSWNPWDAHEARMPGGSSSGSGVAVAMGLTPVGMGSDTGGSIRIPAACCGTVGLKPTYGRASKAGVFALAWSMDHVGPLTRSVADAALVLGAIAGHDPADTSTVRQPVADYVAALDVGAKGLRIGLLRSHVEEAAPVVGEAVRTAAEVLQGSGCTVEPVELATLKYSLAAAYAVQATEAAAYHESLLRQHARAYQVDVRGRILAGRFITATDYTKGQRARHAIRAEVNTLLERYDCLLAPTLPIGAPPVTATEVRIGGGQTQSVRMALTSFTRYFNLSGHPVLAVPCGFDGEGMPLSLQLIGRGFDEATVLRVGYAYEQATEWHRRRPAGQ